MKKAQELREEAAKVAMAVSGRPGLRRRFRIESVAVDPDDESGSLIVALRPRDGSGWGPVEVSLTVASRGASEWLPGSEVIASFVAARSVPGTPLSFAATSEADLVDHALGPQMARRSRDYADGTLLAHLTTHVGALANSVFSRAFARSAFGSTDGLSYDYEVGVLAAELVAMSHLLLTSLVSDPHEASAAFGHAVRGLLSVHEPEPKGRRVQALAVALGELAASEQRWRDEPAARRHRASLCGDCAKVAALAIRLAFRGDADIERSMPPEEDGSAT